MKTAIAILVGVVLGLWVKVILGPWVTRKPRKKPTKPSDRKDEPDIVVTETLAGIWAYHLSMSSDQRKSLCGQAVMPTHARVEWYMSRLGKPRWTIHDESVCAECARLQELLRKKD